MKNFKKILASISLVAILALNASFTIVNAAAINSSTAVATVAGAIADTITVTNTWNFPDGDEISSATIKKLDGTAAWTTTLTVGGNNANADTSVLTVATADLTAATSYIISFWTTSGDFGTVVLNIGTPTNNTVAVSATVDPILTMTLSATTSALGTLSASAITDWATDTTVTIATNADGWYSVFAAASNFVGATTANVIPFVTRAAQVFGTEGFSIDATVGQWGAGDGTVAETAGIGVASTYAVANGAWLLASSAGTTDGDTIVVNYAASISAVTVADSYSTTVTYTVTGTF